MGLSTAGLEGAGGCPEVGASGTGASGSGAGRGPQHLAVRRAGAGGVSARLGRGAVERGRGGGLEPAGGGAAPQGAAAPLGRPHREG